MPHRAQENSHQAASSGGALRRAFRAGLLRAARTAASAICLLSASLTSAGAQYAIESWTTDTGLPQNTVHSILQTPDGYLWLATLDGLVRFDGVRFRVFNKTNTPGINSNRFRQLLLDRRGDLWISTETDGVTRYRDGEFRTYPVGDSGNNSIINFVPDAQGEVVAFTERGIARWDGWGFVLYAPHAGMSNISRALWDRRGALWYSIGSTLRRVAGDGTSEFRLAPAGADDIGIDNLFEDSRGRVWVGTAGAGMFMIEDDRLTVYDSRHGAPSNRLSPRTEDRQGNLWAVSREGLFIVAPDGTTSRVTTEQGLSDDATMSVYEDREGSIWVGTLYRGLNRLSRNSVSFYSRGTGKRADIVHPILQDRDGDVWIGGGSLIRYRDGFSLIPGREQFGKGEVTAIAQDSRGRIWFGHWSGAYLYDDGTYTAPIPELNSGTAIWDIHEDRRGRLWFASAKGLFRHEHGTTTRYTVAEGLPGDDVKVIHESSDGTLWIGTYGGLARLEDDKFTAFKVADGLASDLVRSLYEDREGTLWVGSYDGGLTRFKDDQFTRYTTADGLFNDGVFQILEDEHGYLWMSCNRGIYRVAKKGLNDFAEGRTKRIESVAFGKADGLLETECNGGQQPAGMRARDGRLWFPTQRGVAVIDPASIETNPHPPPVLIESVLLNGAHVPAANFADEKRTLEIAHGIENVEIAYTALSFVKPAGVRFRYRLNGLDSEWVEADGRRTAYYSHIPPGDYTFAVSAANSDGVWNTAGATLRVRVVPPFYRTWWFTLAGFASVAGGAI